MIDVIYLRLFHGILHNTDDTLVNAFGTRRLMLSSVTRQRFQPFDKFAQLFLSETKARSGLIMDAME